MSRFTSVRGATVQHGAHLLRSRKALWQMIREVLSRKYRMSIFTTLVFIFTVLYVIDPFDLIPDWIPVIGWIDDGLVVYLLVRQLHKETLRFSRFKAMERKQPL